MSALAETADGLRDQVTAAEADVTRLASAADELAGQRRAALVEEDDRCLAAVERDLLRVERDRERGRLKLEALNGRLHAAERAEREAVEARKREAMARLCREQLGRAARVDRALAELADAVAAWWAGTLRVRAQWLVDRHGEPLVPEFVTPVSPLLGSIPVELANRLQLAGVNPFGHRPLAELDPASRALALLDRPPPPKPVRAPEEPARVIHSTPGAVTVVRQPGA
jgi:hypothetical protein